MLYSKEDLVALLGTFGWGTFAAALVPTVAIGFNWKRATAFAVNAAIISSLAVNIAIELLEIEIPHNMRGAAPSSRAGLKYDDCIHWVTGLIGHFQNGSERRRRKLDR